MTKKHEKLPSRQRVNIQPTVTKNKVAVLQLDIDMNCTCLTVKVPMLEKSVMGYPQPSSDICISSLTYTLEYVSQHMIFWYEHRRLRRLLNAHMHILIFSLMVGPGHCPMISKYDPSFFMSVDPSFLVLNKSHFNKNIYLTGVCELHKTESTCSLLIQ